METPYPVNSDYSVLPTFFPIPGLGVLPINAFVIKAREPMLVDTGIGIDKVEFRKALESVINPRDLRWIWISHDDLDHIGSVQEMLQAAPKARLVGCAVTALRMSTSWPVPMDRLYALNPGETLDIGDRKLTAFRPPLYDNPMATGFFDPKSKALFSVDSFGAILPKQAQKASDVSQTDLLQGMTVWATVDSPWIHNIDTAKFGKVLDGVASFGATTILSAHLPPAQNMTRAMIETLRKVPEAEPFVPPNQAALEAIFAQMKAGPPPAQR